MPISSARPKARCRPSPDSPRAAAAWARRRKRCRASTLSRAASRSPAAWPIIACACLEQHIGGVATLLAAKLGAVRRKCHSPPSPIPTSTPGSPRWPRIWARPRAARSSSAAASSRPKCTRMVAQINQVARQLARITLLRRSVPSRPMPRSSAISPKQISQGTVKTLFVLGGNPAFNAPAELGFDDLLSKVEQVIRLGCHVDETSAASTTHLPAAHFLESWGDSLAYDTAPIFPAAADSSAYTTASRKSNSSPRWPVCPRPRGRNICSETFADHHRYRCDAAVRRSKMPGTSSSTTDSLAANAVRYYRQHVSWQRFCACATMAPNRRRSSRRARPLQPGEYELDLRSRHDRRRPLRQQRLAPGTARPGHASSPGTTRSTSARRPPTTLGIKIGTANDNLQRSAQHRFRPAHAANSPIAVDPMTAFPMVKVTTPDGRRWNCPSSSRRARPTRR